MKTSNLLNLRFSLIVILILFVLFGCHNKKGIDTQKKEIAILKFTNHPALNELEDGFIENFNSLLSEEQKDTFEIKKFNADRNSQKAKSQAEIIVNNEKTVLILAIATPAAIAVSNTPSKIPFLYGAVADPIGAKIIPEDKQAVRVTGIQNAGPNIIKDAVQFIKIAFPNIKKIGSLYNPSEQNSVYVQELIKMYCDSFDIELINKPVKDAVQVSSMTESLLNEVDLIYSANDNTINSSVATVVAICDAKKKPFIIGDLSTLDKGALFAIGLEYKAMGKDLANIAYEIVIKGKSIIKFPPQDPPKPEIWLNSQQLNKLEIILSDSCKTLINKKI